MSVVFQGKAILVSGLCSKRHTVASFRGICSGRGDSSSGRLLTHICPKERAPACTPSPQGFLVYFFSPTPPPLASISVHLRILVQKGYFLQEVASSTLEPLCEHGGRGAGASAVASSLSCQSHPSALCPHYIHTLTHTQALEQV